TVAGERLHVAIEVIDGGHLDREGVVQPDCRGYVASDGEAQLVRRSHDGIEGFTADAGVHLHQVVARRLWLPYSIRRFGGVAGVAAAERGPGGVDARRQDLIVRRLLP